MKVVGVIPARYSSSRFPGKPLADICGKPMIWWVYNQAKKVDELNELYVATDDSRISEVCENYLIPVIMTSPNAPNHIERIKEVSDNIIADYYICVNGDEPLIDPVSISKLIPQNVEIDHFFTCAMRKLTSPTETIDSSNIKVVISNTGKCIYMSRTPIPYPKGTLLFDYNKYVGIECFNKKALDFFVSKEMGIIEKIEDIDHLRFIENDKSIYFKYVDSESISVDTFKDLEKVRIIIQNKINSRELSNE